MEVKGPQKPARKRPPAGSSSTEYRLYFLDAGGKHFSFSHEFEAEDDERAIRTAESWREGRGAELWARSRKIKVWEADR